MWNAARLLKLAHEEFGSYLMPKLLKVRESYFQWDEDTALNATGEYPIPSRAVGGKLDNIALIDASPTPTSRLDVDLITEDELSDYGSTPAGKPGIYFKRNSIFLVPPTYSGWNYIRQSFFLRPGYFVETTACAQVTAINTLTKVVTFTTVPSTWAITQLFDFIQDKPHFDTLGIDKAISAITTGAAGTMTFSVALPSRLAVGDWVCLANETCVVQAPVEFHGMLAQRVANKAMQSLGDTEGVKTGMVDLESLEKGAIGLITPRAEKESKKLVNRTGLLRRG